MPISLSEYQKLKDQVDRLQREADKASGAHAGLLRRLKEEHECDSVEEAEKALKKLEKEVAKAEKEYEQKLNDFRSKWSEKIT